MCIRDSDDAADADESDQEPADADESDQEPAVADDAAVECPHEGGTVLLFGPYEANESAGVNWRAGVDHGIRDINADGGILGCQIEIEWQDTQADADISKQVVANGVELDPYAIFGTVFSGSTIVNMLKLSALESRRSLDLKRQRSPTVRSTVTTTSSSVRRSVVTTALRSSLRSCSTQA